MKKNEFVKKITDVVRTYENKDGEKLFDVTLKETDAYLNAIKDTIIEIVGSGEEFVWPGFVRFSVIEAAPRKARNPATGEALEIPARKRIKMKALTSLRNAVAE